MTTTTYENDINGTTTQVSTDTHSSSGLAGLVASYRARRSARAERARLEEELSSYRTPAEIHELDAMMERAGDDIDPVYADVVERLRFRAA